MKVAQSCPTLCDPKDYTVHGILQAGILELGSLSFLQGIFLTQGLNPGLPHCRRMLYQLSHQGSPPTFFVSALYLLCTQSLSHSVVSDSLRPHGLQPARLLCAWDSPGRNTEVGCHFLLQCMKVKSESEVAQLCPTLCDPMDCSPPGFSVHGIFQARILEKVAISFFRGSSQPKDQTFHFLHWQADSLPLVPPGKPFQEIHANEILWDEMFMMSTIHS